MAHQASWSRGKGSRRLPGRGGGAHARKKQKWERQAVHKLSCLEELTPPATVLLYSGRWGRDAEESIYLFDQEAAKSKIVYYAEYWTGSWRWPVFSIWVSEENKQAAQQIIERLNPEHKPARST